MQMQRSPPRARGAGLRLRGEALRRSFLPPLFEPSERDAVAAFVILPRARRGDEGRPCEKLADARFQDAGAVPVDDVAHRLIADLHRLKEEFCLFDCVVARHAAQIERVFGDLRHDRALRRFVDEGRRRELGGENGDIAEFGVFNPPAARGFGVLRLRDGHAQIAD